METLMVTSQDLSKLLEFFENNTLRIGEYYGNDNAAVNEEQQIFEAELCQIMDELFGKNLEKRFQYNMIFSQVSAVETNSRKSHPEAWNKLSEINESLQMLRSNIKIKSENFTQRHAEKILKFSDYLDLSLSQQMKIVEKTDQVNSIVETIKETLKVQSSKLAEIGEEKDNLSRSIAAQAKALQDQSIRLQAAFMGILSIFTGVVFTLFGGLTVLSELFSNVHNLAEPKELLGALLVGLFFTLLIYIMGMGLLLFAKQETIENFTSYTNSIMYGGILIVCFLILITILYFGAPVPQSREQYNNKMDNLDLVERQHFDQKAIHT